MNTAALLLVLISLLAALIGGFTAAQQARRLPSARTPSDSGPTGALSGGPAADTDPDTSYRPVPNYPHTEKPKRTEDDAVYRAVTAALQAHSKTSDRKALISNILFFTAGVLASILTTLLVHPL